MAGRIAGLLLCVACAPAPADDAADTDLTGDSEAAATCEDVGVVCVVAGIVGRRGLGDDGVAAVATILALPQDVTVAEDGRWWITDANNHVVREVDAAGVARVVAGTGSPSGAGSVNQPTTVVVDPTDGDVLWVAAVVGNQIGRLDLSTRELTYPVGTGVIGHAGDGGSATEARLWRPSSAAPDATGVLWVSDRMNQVVRRVDVDGTITTAVGQPGVPGYDGDGGPATDAHVSAPPGSEFDPGSRLVVDGARLVLADTGNHAVRVITLDLGASPTVAGVITTLAGGVGRGTADDPDGLGVASFDRPHDVAVADDGTVFVADTGSACVRWIAPDGVVGTLAGRCGEPGDAVQQVAAADARFVAPGGVEVDAHGWVWIADTGNSVVRRVRWRE